jgi:transposase-like protein
MKNSSAISQLQSTWDQLHDLDRAQAVAAIHRSGTSLRRIARDLGHSDSLLRRLLLALQTPAEDQALAREGAISTNELVRRGKAEAVRQEKNQFEAREFERKHKVVEGSKKICHWLEQEHLAGSRGEAIALEARSMLIANYTAGKLPHADEHVVRPVTEWIERCRPETSMPDDTSYISWYALWLARWSFCFCRHPEIAIDALAIAGRL